MHFLVLLTQVRSYVIEGRVCYLTMCDRAYPKKLAFQYLEDLKNEFERVNGSQIETAARPYAFIKFGTHPAILISLHAILKVDFSYICCILSYICCILMFFTLLSFVSKIHSYRKQGNCTWTHELRGIFQS